MSNLKVCTRLEGYVGPFFPPILGALHKAFANGAQFDRDTLTFMGAGIEGFRYADAATTVDGYPWLLRLNFKVGNDKVTVLFPNSEDKKYEDGTLTDRHVALYVQSGTNMERISSLLARLAREFQIFCTPHAVPLP